MRIRIKGEAPLPARQCYYPALKQDQDTIQVLTQRIATELLHVNEDQVALYIDGFELPAHVSVTSILRDNDLVTARRRELANSNDGRNRVTGHRPNSSTSSPGTSSSSEFESSSSDESSDDENESAPTRSAGTVPPKKDVIVDAPNDNSSSEVEESSSDSSSEDELSGEEGDDEKEEVDTSPLSQFNIRSNNNNKASKYQKTPGPLPKPLIKPRLPPTPGKLKPLSPPPPPDEGPRPLIYDAIPVGHDASLPQYRHDDHEPPSAGKNHMIASQRPRPSSQYAAVEEQQSISAHTRKNNQNKPTPIPAPPLSLAGTKRKTLTKMLAKPATHVRFDGYDENEDQENETMEKNQRSLSEASVKPRMLFTRADLYDGTVYDSPNNRNGGTPIAAPLTAINPTTFPPTKFTQSNGPRSSSRSNVNTSNAVANREEDNILGKKRQLEDQLTHDTDSGKKRRRRRRSKRKSNKGGEVGDDISVHQNGDLSLIRDQSMEDLVGDHEGINEITMDVDDFGNQLHGIGKEEFVTIEGGNIIDEGYGELLKGWQHRRKQAANGGQNTLIPQEKLAVGDAFENHLQEMWNTVANTQQISSSKVLEKAAANKPDLFGKPSPIAWLNLPLPKGTPATVVPPARLNRKSMLNPTRLIAASPTPSTVNESTKDSVNNAYKSNSNSSNYCHPYNNDGRRSATPHPVAIQTTNTAQQKDYSFYPIMGIPNVGDVLAYQVLQLVDYQPTMSDYREAQIMAFDVHNQLLTLRPLHPENAGEGDNDKIQQSKKFDLPPDEEYVVQDHSVERREGEDYKIKLKDLCDARIVS